METRKTTKPYPADLRDRGVRLVREHANERASEWATICSIAEKVGCSVSASPGLYAARLDALGNCQGMRSSIRLFG